MTSAAADETIRRKAFELFCAHGFAGVSVRDVAAAADVSPGVVTYHFPKKEDLFAGAVEAPYGRFVDELRQRVDNDRPAKERLRAVIELLSDPSAELRSLLRLLLRQVLDSVEPLAPLAPTVLHGHIALLGRLLGDAQREGALPPGVGIGALPIIFGGTLMPQVIGDAVQPLPGAELVLSAIRENTKESLLTLLGLT